MSIAALTLQYLTVQALKGQTLAGDNVLGSPTDPHPGEDDLKPIINVFTGDDDRDELEGTDILGANREIEITIQVYAPGAVSVDVGGTPQIIDPADSGGDILINMIWRQIERTFQASDSAWARLWRDLVVSIKKVTSQAYLFELDKQNARVPAREITYRVSTLSDPPYGGPLEYFWERLVAAFKSDPYLAPIGQWLEQEITAPGNLTPARKAQAALGLSDETAAAIGIMPLADNDAAATAFTVSDEQAGTFTVDAGNADDALPPDETP